MTKSTQSLYGAAITVDATDAIYVTGSLPGQTIITARYDQVGNQVWLREFDNPGTREQASSITTDPRGYIIVTGRTVGGATDDPTGAVVLAYDPDGTLVWFDVLPIMRGLTVRAAVDPVGNTYVVGRAFVTNSSANTTDDMMTIRYLPDGTRDWIRYAGVDAFSADEATSLALTAAGDVVVTGGAVGWMLTVAYDPGGAVVFERTERASSRASDVAIGPADEIYIVGTTYSVASGNEFLVVGYDAAGNPSSSRTYPGYAASRVVVDGDGNVIVTGYATAIPPRAYADWLTHKIDPAGTILWTQRYDQHAANDEFPYWMALGADGEVYITGQGGPGPTTGELSYLRTVTVRYSATGDEDWVASTFDSVRGLGVASGSDGSVVVVGQSPFLVLHYLACASVPGETSGLVAVRAGDDIDLSWTPAVGASASNVWTVTAAQDIERARATSAPPAVGVVGCSPPNSVAGGSCVDVGGVSRVESPLFYQVRGVCPGLPEGP